MLVARRADWRERERGGKSLNPRNAKASRSEAFEYGAAPGVEFQHKMLVSEPVSIPWLNTLSQNLPYNDRRSFELKRI